MKHKTWVRVVSLLLLLALIVGVVPSVFAAGSDAESASVVEAAASEQTEETDTSPQISPPVQTELTPVEEAAEDDDGPLSDDGQSLTRDEELLAATQGGIMLFSARAATGTMGKQLCVSYSRYESPTWYCHRYEVDGTHKYGHYFYSYEMAYHSIDGELAYCVERATRS